MTSLLQAIVRVADSRTSDADLLARYVSDRDERAFEELVRRHGPLVWSVCRHLLAHHADAEDAFQAVFLALVRSAGSIRDGRALPAWLHGVAMRVAEKAKRSAVRRRQREHRAAVPEADRPVPDESWSALMTAVHEEIRKLPEAERTAFVLCDLEGVRQPDAAKRLGWPLGTLSGRLCKARQRLLDQLTRRGIAPAVLAVGGVAGTAGSVPALLFNQVLSFSTAGAVGVSSTVAQLARGLVEGATMRMKVLAATLLVAGTIGMTTGAMVLSKADAQDPNVVKEVQELVTGLGQAQPPAAGGGGRSGGGVRVGEFDGQGRAGGSENVRSVAVAGSHAWDYKLIETRNDRKEFERTLNQLGKDGWEYCGSERFSGQGPSELTMVFKKGKGGATLFGGMSGGGFGAGTMGMPGGALGGVFGGGGGRGGPGGLELPGMGGLGGPMGGVGGKHDVVAKTFKLKSVAASDVVVAVEKSPAFKKSFKIIAEPYTNFVIVIADPAGITELTKVIEALDAKPRTAPPGSGGGGPGRGPAGSSSGGRSLPPMGGGAANRDSKLTVFSLKNARALELTPVLNRVFPTAEVTAEERTNQLIVRADEKTTAELEALIKRLDVDGKQQR